MPEQLTPQERHQAQQLLAQYAPAQTALAHLEANQGNLDAAFTELWHEKNGLTTFGPHGTLWQAVKAELRNELCGDEGFRNKLQTYLKQPGDAAALTSIVIYVVGLTTLPLDPALATIFVLYIVKFGLNVFCRYTEPEAS